MSWPSAIPDKVVSILLSCSCKPHCLYYSPNDISQEFKYNSNPEGWKCDCCCSSIFSSSYYYFNQKNLCTTCFVNHYNEAIALTLREANPLHLSLLTLGPTDIIAGYITG